MILEETDWDKYMGYEDSFFNREFLRAVFRGYLKILKPVSISRGISILELGAGSGYNSYNIAMRFRASKVTLVDLNDKALEASKKIFGKNTKLTLVKENVLKFESDERYDLVHSQGLIEHFQGSDLKTLIDIHIKHAKKGGYIVIFYPTPSFVYRFLRKGLEIFNAWIFTDEVPLKKEQLLPLINKNKIEVLNIMKILKLYFTEEGLLLKKIK